MSFPPSYFWLVHITVSLVVAASALGVGKYLHTRLRLSHAAHGYWLAVWMLAALPPVCVAILSVCLPTTMASLPAAVLPLPVAIDPGTLVDYLAGHPVHPMLARPSLGATFAVLYMAGLAICVIRWMRGNAKVGRIVRAAHAVDTSTWPGLTSLREAQELAGKGISIRSTDQKMSPFAVTWPKPCIVLPQDALEQMRDAELRLVLRHEAAHITAGDPARAFLMSTISALLWFNPFLGFIAARVQMAAELRCDARALGGDAAAGPVFANAYVQALRSYASLRAPVTALNHADLAGHRLRIQHMLKGDSGHALSRPLRFFLPCVGLTGILAISLVQAAMAVSGTAAIQTKAQATSSASHGNSGVIAQPATLPVFTLESPLGKPRITGQFGDIGSIRTQPHRGTDFGARVGTPVLAPAAGTVMAATTRYPDGPHYGTVVVLDHGNGWQTLYAHLDNFDVRVGQRVAAGEQIARVGRSGRTTGAHLHLEALHEGQRVDPEHLMQ